MSLEDLQGSTYGPFPVRATAERVSAYVAATGDDAARWVEHAPPSFAGALLFAAAPTFLNADPVKPYTKLLVHADQAFTWHRPLEIDELLTVDGVLARVRTRKGVSFATFRATVRSADEPVIDATSTFLMGDGRPTELAEEEDEPAVEDRGAHDPLPATLVASPGPVHGPERSASRLDLVRYAAASGDFNPVHFDHATARRAGFGGVLVHGLLMGAWLIQFAAAHSPRNDPIASAKLRFKNPLRPAVTAKVSGEVGEITDEAVDLRLSLSGGEDDYVKARIRVRTA